MYTLRVVKRLRKTLGSWLAATPQRPKPRHRFKPRLEALEERWCPAGNMDTLIWSPQNGSNNANDQTNWYDTTLGQGATMPGATNPIQLDGSKAGYNQPIEVTQDLSVASLTVQNNYNNTLTIDKGAELATTGNNTINNGSTLTLVSPGSDGILLNDFNTFTVQSGGTLNLTDPPQATAGSTFMGEPKNFQAYLSNAGTVNWKGTAVASGATSINDVLGVPVLNTGTFNVDGGTNGVAGSKGGILNILNQDLDTNSVSFDQTSGSLNFKNGALVSVYYGYYQSGGSITSDSTTGDELVSGDSGTGDINIAGGNIVVDNVANTVSTLIFVASTVEMNGELDVSGLTTGGTSFQCDKLNCGGAKVTLGSNSYLNVGTTGNGALGKGNNWTVMTYGSFSGSWGQVTVPQGMGVSTNGTSTVVSGPPS